MKKITILLTWLCLVQVNGLSQDKEPKDPKQVKQLMKEKINVLKNGVLLVRLHTKENSVQALMSAGNSEKARQVDEKQKAYNKSVIAAFRSNFKFCPVYFFAGKYSENITSGNMQLVLFYNDSLVEDPNIKISYPDFLTAEFGPLDPDTASYYEGYYLDRSGSNLQKNESRYQSGNLGIEALKIMNREFIQLTDPFPYYVRTFESLPIERNLSKTVSKMDTKLTKFYDANKAK